MSELNKALDAIQRVLNERDLWESRCIKAENRCVDMKIYMDKLSCKLNETASELLAALNAISKDESFNVDYQTVHECFQLIDEVGKL